MPRRQVTPDSSDELPPPLWTDQELREAHEFEVARQRNGTCPVCAGPMGSQHQSYLEWMGEPTDGH